MNISLLRYLPLVGISVIIIWLLYSKWDFIKGTFSEIKNGVERGSATRISAIMFVVTICFNELYITLRTKDFKYDHLVALLISVGVLFGYIKVMDYFSFIKGNSIKSTETNTTTVQIENEKKTE